MQHRVKIGCFVGMISSSKWRPSSSGKLGSSHSSDVKTIPIGNYLSFLMLFIKLLIVALPFMIVCQVR
jgi:hypothetical protein